VVANPNKHQSNRRFYMYATTINILAGLGILSLFSYRTKIFILTKFREDNFYFIFPGAVAASAHLFYGILEEGMQLISILLVSGYFLLPGIILMSAHHTAKLLGCWQDFAAAAVMFLVPMILGKKFGGTHDLPFFISTAILNCLVLYTGRSVDMRWELPDSWQHWLVTIVATVGTIIILAIIGESIEFIGPHFGLGSIDYLWQSMLNSSFVMLLVYKAGMVAAGEEIIFRGVIYSLLDERWGPTIALTVSSVCFGLAHLGHGMHPLTITHWNWRYVIMASLAGLAYGWLYNATKSIAYPIFMHMWVDAISRTLYLFIDH
jgi:membrane protease YdiL (CAAX protease family)